MAKREINTNKQKRQKSEKYDDGIPKKKIKVDKLQNYLSTCDSSGYAIYLKDDTKLIPEKRNHFISSYSIYTKLGLLKPIDDGLLNDELYLSGYIVPNKSAEIEVRNKRINNIGPIIKRYCKMTFNGSEENFQCILETSECLYTLAQPDTEYKVISENHLKILKVTAFLISYLVDRVQKDPCMKNLHNFIKHKLERLKLNYHKDFLRSHANYLYSNILAIKNLPKDFFKMTCIQVLNKYYQDTPQITVVNPDRQISKYSTATKATITPAIQNILKAMEDTIDFENHSDLEISDKFVDKNDTESNKMVYAPIKKGKPHPHLQFSDDYIKKDTIYFYQCVKYKNNDIKIGDFIDIKVGEKLCIIEIILIFKEDEMIYLHGKKYVQSCHTILGSNNINPREIYMTNDCCAKCPISAIVSKINVTKIIDTHNQFKICSKAEYNASDDRYFCQKMYSPLSGRFEDLPLSVRSAAEKRKSNFRRVIINTSCIVCEHKFKNIFSYIPQLKERNEEPKSNKNNTFTWNILEWKNEVYTIGVSVFLKPDTIPVKDYSLLKHNEKRNTRIDRKMYPESFRKKKDSSMESNEISPYQVGIITKILSKNTTTLYVRPSNIFLEIQLMYRPENITKHFSSHDLNKVYWSTDTFEVPFEKLIGICSLHYQKLMLDKLYQWSEEDHNRFYFNQAIKNNTLQSVPDEIKLQMKVKENIENVPMKRKLQMMDIFAGCGGFSEGICKSGVAECKWAIENNTNACKSFKENHHNVTIFNEDCNKLLTEILHGNEYSSEGHKLPKPGEVDLLCGGPPCQGFSGMNRFSDSESSQLKNSLVATYLSYCDYYRPTYFVMENVKNFAFYNDQAVLKCVITCLLEMGYQCAVSILQAGQFGVPQSRKRIIIFAAAPGHKLPEFPEPSYVFDSKTLVSSLKIDNEVLVWSKNFTKSAPRRMLTVKDALSDLPPIKNEEEKSVICISYPKTTHYQRLLRKGDRVFSDNHKCKRMTPIANLRISLIPKFPRADWRDLPNIEMNLEDNTHTDILKYYKSGEKYGVCCCSIINRECHPKFRQENTIIPWCLAHTADKNNNWAGLYGRLSNDSYFETIVTNPDPLRKQGKVIHPTEDRILSVREYARAQGFPDSYKFYGLIHDQYIQIGNAVPPPLGYAIGKEIKKAYHNE